MRVAKKERIASLMRSVVIYWMCFGERCVWNMKGLGRGCHYQKT